MSNEVETSATNGQPDQQAAPKAPSKKEKKKGMKESSWALWGDLVVVTSEEGWRSRESKIWPLAWFNLSQVSSSPKYESKTLAEEIGSIPLW